MQETDTKSRDEDLNNQPPNGAHQLKGYTEKYIGFYHRNVWQLLGLQRQQFEEKSNSFLSQRF